MIDAIPLLLAPEGYQISRSVRLRSSATAYLSRSVYSVASAGTQWTLSMWVKRGALSNGDLFSFVSTTGAAQQAGIQFDGNNNIRWWQYAAPSYQFHKITTAVFRDPSAWYHLVFDYDTTLATAADRCQIWVNGVRQTAFSTSVDPSLNLVTYYKTGTLYPYIGAENRNASSALTPFDGYITEVNFIDGQSLDPSSFGEINPVTGVWQPKKYTGTYGTNGFYLPFSNPTTAENRITNSQLIGSTGWIVGNVTVVTNTIVAPDGSTTASSLTATSADSNLYSNVSVTNGVTYTGSVWLKAPSTTEINLYADTNASGSYVGPIPITVTTSWQRFQITFTATGTLAGFIIGAGSSFTTGEVIHAWGAQVASGAAPGAYIRTSGSAITGVVALGQDFSLGNGSYNTWTPNNISVTAGVTYDSMLDVPTQWADGGNGRGNYCTLNRLVASGLSGGGVLSNGNLRVSGAAAVSNAYARGTMTLSGKFYAEFSFDVVNATASIGVDVVTATAGALNTSSTNVSYRSGGNRRVLGTETAYGASWVANDIIGVAVDTAANTVEFFKNGTSQGVITSSAFFAQGDCVFAMSKDDVGSPNGFANFGQRPFSYTPPTGFLALNTQNLPTPTILKGNQYFDATIWTGDGNSTRTISSVGFQPDFVWVKQRDIAQNHALSDSARGAGNILFSDATSADFTSGIYGQITSFNSNGFTASKGTDPTLSFFNRNAGSYVGWQWKEGATQGFDIVTGTSTGATGTLTLAHNLGVAPSMVIAKNRDLADNWYSWHQSLGASSGGFRVQLNQTNAVVVSGGIWGTGHTSSNVLFGQNNWFTASGQRIVAYLFSEVAGFSRFGSYTGNGSADGPFVFCGFRPRFVMIKRTDTTGTWLIEDTGRNTYNLTDLSLSAESSAAETTQTSIGNPIDVLSNGFKCRGTGASSNASGGTYIFAAFAENPFKNALAR